MLVDDTITAIQINRQAAAEISVGPRDRQAELEKNSC